MSSCLPSKYLARLRQNTIISTKACCFNLMIRIFWLVFTSVIFISSSYAVAIKQSFSDNIIEPSFSETMSSTVFPRDTSNLYMVLLKDESLARYRGDDPRFSATSILANKSNSQAQGYKLDVHSVTSQRYLAHLKANRQNAINAIGHSIHHAFKPEHEYQYALNGFTARFTSAQLSQVKANKHVKQVLKITPRRLMTDSSPAFIHAPSVWQGNGVNAGTQGEGVIVAVLDSGISPSHPSFAEIAGDGYRHLNPLGSGNYLGDCAKSEFAKYCNNKLIGIWSHPDITNEYTPVGDDPIGIDHDGHGTHVAGIAVGNVLTQVPVENVIGDIADKRLEQISGVAPRANLIAYQVCAADFGCYPDLTALAVEHAIEHGVDVINYSVGGDQTSPWQSVDSLAFLSAREAGIDVAVSAGNDGPALKSISSPANAPWLTSVAAIDHGRAYNDKSISFSGGENSLSTMSGAGITNGVSGEIVLAKDYGDEDCLTPFAPNTFNDKIVVCVRNDIPRVEKGRNVLAGGARGMVLINDPAAPETNNIVADYHILPAIHLDRANGENLVAWLAQGNNHQASISNSETLTDVNQVDRVGNFSSRGLDFIQKWLSPSVAAPGIDVYAANSNYQPHYDDFKKNESDYVFNSGTSMASPHAAGALALIAGVHPNWSPAEAQSALMLSAVMNTTKVSDNQLVAATPFDSGAGSIRVDNAVNSGLIMDISPIAYQLADYQLGGDPATLNHPSLVDVDCQLRCTWQRTFTATRSANWQVSVNTLTDFIDVDVSPSNFSLNNGQSITLTFNAQMSSADKQNFVDDYGLANITLTPDNNSVMALSLPLVATFIPGRFPDDLAFTVDTDQGSQAVTGIETIATNDLLVQVHALAVLNKVTINLFRDGIDTADWPNNIFNQSEFYYENTITVPENSKYLWFDIVATSSPDIDVYLVRDSNTDGRVNSSEITQALCESATLKALEVCRIENPRAGEYAFLIHNYGNPDKNESINDNIMFEWAVVKENSENLSVSFNPTVIANNAIDLTLNWFPPLERGQTYVSVFEIGTSRTTADNVGLVPFRFTRSDKVLAAQVDNLNITSGDDFTVTFTLDSNRTNSEKSSEIILNLPTGVTLKSDNQQGVISNNQIRWQLLQAANSPMVEIIATFTTVESTSTSTFPLIYRYQLGEETGQFSAGTLTIQAKVTQPPPSSNNDSSGGGSGGALFWLLLMACLIRLSRIKQVVNCG